jgi:hypothetical protein
MTDIKRTIATFFKDPEPVSRLADVVPGLNIVDGIVRIDEPLRSPVKGQNCAAYFYRSFLVLQGGRSGQPGIHKLRQAEVYAPFHLELEGGALPVVPSKPGTFTREAHQELARQYGQGFHGIEETVLPGARVRVRGKARVRDGATVFSMTELTVIEKQVMAAGVVGDRKQRRKKKK